MSNRDSIRVRASVCPLPLTRRLALPWRSGILGLGGRGDSILLPDYVRTSSSRLVRASENGVRTGFPVSLPARATAPENLL